MESPTDAEDQYGGDSGAELLVRRGGLGDLSGDVGTVLTDAHGNVNSGSGLQMNFHVLGRPAPLRVRPTLGVKGIFGGVEFLHRVFVRPPGFHKLQERLNQPGSTVILTGPPGCGRRTAAQMLLCPSADDARSLRLLSSADLVGDERLSAEDVSEVDRLMLDVSDLDLESFAACQVELVNCAAIVNQQRASLVVLVPDQSHRLLHDDLQSLRERIGYPDRWQVLDSHLNKEYRLPLKRSSISSEIHAFLDQLPLRDVARVAKYLDETRSQGLGTEAWVSGALTGLEDHEKAIATLLDRLQSVEDRTLLLTAAMLEASSLESVYFAEGRLQAALGYELSSEPHRLAQPGIADRVRAVGDELQVSEGTVRFSRPAFGTALLDHFWDGYPDLRRQFAQWVSTSYAWADTDAQDRAAVAQRFAAQTVRTLQLSELYGLVESWADAGRDEQRRLAVGMMTQVLLDDRSGPLARQQLYNWAYSPKLSSSLGQIVIQLCRHVVAASHLKQALIRLRWLADHSAIREAACVAIVGLCNEDRALELFAHVLIDRDRFDRELCRRVLAPERLSARPGQRPALIVPRLRRSVVVAWRRAVERWPTDEWCLDWLNQHALVTAAGDLPVASALRAVLIDICDRNIARLAQVYTANQQWHRRVDSSTPATLQAASAIEASVRRAIADLANTPRPEGTNDETD
ncbi:hypothetical protein ACFV9C_40770 [Kribbella sp. NPDC059898]|uniref:hypothetical protein n=1 Tax=Kribbella sp. NPDC059898 TaxID=3346995 RepID=UPI00365A219B